MVSITHITLCISLLDKGLHVVRALDCITSPGLTPSQSIKAMPPTKEAPVIRQPTFSTVTVQTHTHIHFIKQMKLAQLSSDKFITGLRRRTQPAFMFFGGFFFGCFVWVFYRVSTRQNITSRVARSEHNFHPIYSSNTYEALKISTVWIFLCFCLYVGKKSTVVSTRISDSQDRQCD